MLFCSALLKKVFIFFAACIFRSIHLRMPGWSDDSDAENIENKLVQIPPGTVKLLYGIAKKKLTIAERLIGIEAAEKYGVAVVAALLGVSRQTLHSWKVQHAKHPYRDLPPSVLKGTRLCIANRDAVEDALEAALAKEVRQGRRDTDNMK